MGALRNLIGTEARKLFQTPARWREVLRPRRWRQFLHVAVFYLRTGNRWQAEPSDGSFERRVYPSYQDYLRRQQAKLEYLDLSHYEAEYQRLLSERLAGVDGLKKGAAVLCLGARLGAEVRAFHDCGCFAVGLDLNPGRQNRYVLNGDFHELQFPRASADVIFSNSLDHVFAVDRFIAEIRRVLKPGGRLIFVDSVQTGDEPDYDALLDYFPFAFHEPYYASYLTEDLDRLMRPGFTPEKRSLAYFSKVVTYRRGGQPPTSH